MKRDVGDYRFVLGMNEGEVLDDLLDVWFICERRKEILI